MQIISTRLRSNFKEWRFRFAFGLALFEEGFALDLFNLFIPLPFLDRFAWDPDDMMESWSIAIHERSLYLHWGTKFKFLHFPWDWQFYKHEVQRSDGSWVPFVGSWEQKESDGRWQADYLYTYTLKSGEVQKRTATIYVERREWRWRWFMWLPRPRLKRKSINVDFDAEVGEKTGSWKGGCTGCSYEMLPDEGANETLRRMERERTF